MKKQRVFCILVSAILTVSCIFSFVSCKPQETPTPTDDSAVIELQLLNNHKNESIDELFAYVKAKIDENYYSESSRALILDILQESIGCINVAENIANVDTIVEEQKGKIGTVATLEVLGEFYTFQEAYDKGYMTVEDLQLFGGEDVVPETYDLNVLPLKFIKSIKQLYFNEHIAGATDEHGKIVYPYAKLEDITNNCIRYYGEFNGVYCFRIWDPYASYPEGYPVDRPEIIGGVKFYVTGPPYMIWKI